MSAARSQLFEHFDEDVHARLRLSSDRTAEQVSRFEDWLWRLTKYELSDCASFDPGEYAFVLEKLPEHVQGEKVRLGRYRLVTHRNGADEHHYRLGHPLAEHIIERAKGRALPVREVEFLYSDHPTKLSVIEALRGETGWLRVHLFSIHALEREDHLILSAMDDSGRSVDPETSEKLFGIAAGLGAEVSLTPPVETQLNKLAESMQNEVCEDIASRNKEYFETEMEKLERWAEDLKGQLETELKDLDRDIKATKREARQAVELDDKVALHRKAKDLEKRRNDKRRRLFEAQDEIDIRKEDLLAGVEERLKQQMTSRCVFTLRWRVL